MFLDEWKKYLNANNPLGYKGNFAKAFSEFVKKYWNSDVASISPSKFKSTIADSCETFDKFSYIYYFF